MHHISRPAIYGPYNPYDLEGSTCRYCGKRPNGYYHMDPCTGQCHHFMGTPPGNWYGR
jgi:hypothetical protein